MNRALSFVVAELIAIAISFLVSRRRIAPPSGSARHFHAGPAQNVLALSTSSALMLGGVTLLPSYWYIFIFGVPILVVGLTAIQRKRGVRAHESGELATDNVLVNVLPRGSNVFLLIRRVAPGLICGGLGGIVCGITSLFVTSNPAEWIRYLGLLALGLGVMCLFIGAMGAALGRHSRQE